MQPTLEPPSLPPILPAPEPPLVSRLGIKLRQVAEELRAARLHRASMKRWAWVTAGILALFGLRLFTPETAGFMLPAMAVVVIAAMWLGILAAKRAKLDFLEAAAAVEREHPELRQALRTAAEQMPDETGRYNFLQLRVVGAALHHGWRNDWLREPRRRTRRAVAGHVAAVAVAIVAAGLVLIQGGPLMPWAPAPAAPPPGILAEISVTPGDQEVERNSAVVIAARFNRKLPREVELGWTSADGKSGRALMARHLSDPVFVFNLPRVASDTKYHVLFDRRRTDDFTLTVFDYPALVRADATLDYPEFTGLPDRRIQNTRRISAVVGTGVKYDFAVNKPLRSASLADADGNTLELSPANSERTQFTTSFTIEQSRRYTLRLEDDRGRVNPAPVDIRIEALENRRPTVRMTFPRRDRRVSALEEMTVAAEAREDFGLLDYGFAFSVGEGEMQYISLAPIPAPEKAPVQTAFNNTFALEPYGLEVGQLVTWVAWADDNGPDGERRRTTTDLFFGEVRPFEEIFREANDAQAEAQQQQQQIPQEQQDLIELQRDISVAIWKLRQLDRPGPTFAADVQELATAQTTAMSMLESVRADFTNARQQAVGAEAAKFMTQSSEGLAAANDKKSLEPLASGWTGAQGAYQALLKLQAREFNVARAQQQQGQQQQQRRQRNQEQLDQLRFRQQENRYETESQAQAQQPLTEEQRQQIEVQSRLRDLARRQQDINERVRELQSALEAAQTEQQREELRRELRRLEEEQRQMLNELDEARQRLENLPPGEQQQQAREELEQAREDMNRAAEQLGQNNLSQAAAAGARTQEQLENTQESLRQQTSSAFTEQMREARRVARELEQSQLDAERRLAQMDAVTGRALDDSAQRQAIAETLDSESRELSTLMENLRQITDDSESTEPNLHRQLYDLLRQQSQFNTGQQLQNGAELLRRGFVEQSQEAQSGVSRNLTQLRQGVERAASSILGDEQQELRFAQAELDSLMRELQREAPQDAQTGEQNPQNGRQPEEGAQGARQSGQDGQQPANDDAQGQQQGPGGQPGGQRGQGGLRGQNGQGLAENGQPGGQRGGQTPSSEDFRGQDPALGENGEGRQGQPGGQRQGGQPGQSGRPDEGAQGGNSEDFRNGEQQAADGQPGRQTGPGGQRGQGAQSQTGEPQEGQQGEGQGSQAEGQQGQGGQRGQGQRGQGQGQGEGQGQGQNGQGGEPGDSEQQSQAQGQGQGQGQGQARGQGGRQGGQGRQGGARQTGQGGQQRGGNERAGGGGPAGPANPLNGGDNLTSLDNLLNGGWGGGDFTQGPITGENYGQWIDRLRTVENLVEDPNLRQQLATARNRIEDYRREWQRRGEPPRWGDVQSSVMAPLSEVRLQLARDLARREQPESLLPADRDPVPDRYSDSVRSYYENLSSQ